MSKHIFTWPHKNASGQVIGEIKRFIDANGNKQDTQYYIPNATGEFDKGTTEAMKNKGNPLFGLETIFDKNTPVFVCEGQKCATAFAGLSYQCVTSILGANNAHNSDWTVLKGAKEIWLFPDNDEAGESYIKNVVEILNGFANPPTMQIARLPNLPIKGDICDYLKQQSELANWNELDSLDKLPAKEIIRAKLDEIIANNLHPVPQEWIEWEDYEEIANSILLPVEPLPPAIIPEPYREFIIDAAQRMPCPIDFIAIVGIVTTAAIVGAGCSIRPKQFDNWSVVPNLWGVAIGEPSKLKTPALKVFLDLLTCLEDEAKKDFEDTQNRDEADFLVYKTKLKQAENFIAEAVKSRKELEIEDAKHQYELLKREEPEKLVRRRFKTNDSTIEKMGELLSTNPRGILLFRDELIGLLRSWDKDGHENDRAFYLEAWNGGGSYTTDRIGRGTIDIKNACVSIIGGIQPDRLTDYLYQSIHGDNDGFIQRLQLAVFPDKIEWQLVDQPPKINAKQRALAILNNLKNMDFIKYGASLDEESKAPYFNFCPSAQKLFYDWLVDNQRKVEAEPLSLVQEHLIKYRKLMPSLALLFHLIDIADNKSFADPGVSYDATEKAAAWCDYLESHARRIYGLCATFEQQATKSLAEKITKGKLRDQFTLRDVYRNEWHMLTEKKLALAACEELIDAKWLRANVTRSALGQKPKILYLINPKLKIEDKK